MWALCTTPDLKRKQDSNFTVSPPVASAWIQNMNSNSIKDQLIIKYSKKLSSAEKYSREVKEGSSSKGSETSTNSWAELNC